MPLSPEDEAISERLIETGTATPEQITAAQQLQSALGKRGVLMPLLDALYDMKVISHDQRIEFGGTSASGRTKTVVKQLGQYRLLRKLGEGSMGSVYQAKDMIVDRWVALKILSQKLAKDPVSVSRFHKEARSAASLDHPNIVRALTAGEDQGLHYLVMEFCDGMPLDAYLKERGGQMAPEEALNIILQAARGLEHAHKNSILHRDIKPANIFITKEKAVKILDLGLSKNLEEADAFNTRAGVAVGTPHYISPEQARSEKTIDGRADMYSLGATFYTILTGRTPYEGNDGVEVVMKHLREQLQDPRDIRPDIPDEYVYIIQKMMAKSRDDRYADCTALISEIERVSRGEAPQAVIESKKSSVAMRPIRGKSVTRAMRKEPEFQVIATENMTPGAGSPRRNARGSASSKSDIPQMAPSAGQFTDAMPPPTSSSKGMVFVALGAIAIISAAAAYFLTGGTEPQSNSSAQKIDIAKTAAPSNAQKNNSKADNGDAPVVGARKVELDKLKPADKETLAADEFAKLMKFEGIDPANKAARMQRLQEFIEMFPDAIVTARARAELRSIDPKAEAQANPANPPTTPTTPPAPPVPAPAVVPKTVVVAPPVPGLERAKGDDFEWRGSTDLLASIDLAKDPVAGGWKVQNGMLTSDAFPAARVEFPFQPAQEYDIRVIFTRVSGNDAVVLRLSREGRAFLFAMGAVENSISLYGSISGHWLDDQNPTRQKMDPVLQNGKTHVCVVQVREGQLTAKLDGKVINDFKPDYNTLDTDGRDKSLIGVGSANSAVAFHQVQVIDRTGRGHFIRKAARVKVAQTDAARKDAERKALAALASTPGDPSRERDAETAMTNIEALFAQRKYADCKQAIEAFRKDYHNTPMLARNRATLDKRWANADDALNTLQPGLYATYWANNYEALMLAKPDSKLVNDWGENSPDAKVPKDNFQIRWRGILRITRDADYSFNLLTEDTGTIIIDGDKIATGQNAAGTVPLGKGDHDVAFIFAEGNAGAKVKFQWKPYGETKFVDIPESVLFHDRRRIPFYENE